MRDLKNIPFKQLIAILNQPFLELHRLRTDLIFLYKILHGQVDTNLKRLFVMASDVSTCNLRLHGHANELKVPKLRTDLLKNCYVYRVVMNRSSLPFKVCAAKSYSLFKQRLTEYLCNTD